MNDLDSQFFCFFVLLALSAIFWSYLLPIVALMCSQNCFNFSIKVINLKSCLIWKLHVDDKKWKVCSGFQNVVKYATLSENREWPILRKRFLELSSRLKIYSGTTGLPWKIPRNFKIEKNFSVFAFQNFEKFFNLISPVYKTFFTIIFSKYRPFFINHENTEEARLFIVNKCLTWCFLQCLSSEEDWKNTKCSNCGESQSSSVLVSFFSNLRIRIFCVF